MVSVDWIINMFNIRIMNREIKFRAWHEPSKTMFKWEDFSLNGRNGCVIHFDEGVFTTSKVDNNSVVLIQFIGFKDKNGKEIYEGDIVDYKFSKYSTRRYIIKYSNNAFVLNCIKTPQHSLNTFAPASVKVMGDIHQNKDLL